MVSWFLRLEDVLSWLLVGGKKKIELQDLSLAGETQLVVVVKLQKIKKDFLKLMVVGELLEADTVGNEKLLHKIVNVVERDNNVEHLVMTVVDNALLVHVIKAIHGEEAGTDIRGCQTNGVWASIVGSIYHLHSSGIVSLHSICFKVGDGSSIQFWKDTWLGDEPLYIRYNILYHLENNKDCSIRHCLVNGSWAWEWSRTVNVGRSKVELDALILDIANLETDEHIDDHTLPSLSPSTRWCKVILEKVNIGMWWLFLDRLSNRLNLSSRGLDIDSMVCNSSVESSVHTFFTCGTASVVWRCIHTWTGSSLPLFSSCDDWDIWLQSWHASNIKKDRAYTIFAATCWTL
nr:RNA-directed DNA polymerase, eukaryota [Tanacetum cinerariifolium]